MRVAGYKGLIGNAADSPIVDDEGDEIQFYGGDLVIYRF
jgi:outer membrane scaffolding protein for murein synthesis (MipA/OmpV family)